MIEIIIIWSIIIVKVVIACMYLLIDSRRWRRCKVSMSGTAAHLSYCMDAGEWEKLR
jgi:hypothetical protein